MTALSSRNFAVEFPIKNVTVCSGVPTNFFGGRGCPTNSVEYGAQIERGSGGGSPLDSGSAQFANG
jgi:hypothetical protein